MCPRGIGRWKELQEIPTKVRVEVSKVVSGDFDERLFYPYLMEINKAIEHLTFLIKMDVDLILRLAGERGITLEAVPKCCRVPRCGTCLGKYPYHYPYFYIHTESRRRIVSARRLREFLSELGMTADQIEMFDGRVKARHILIAMFHNSIRNLNALGMSTLKLEEAPIKVEVEADVSG
jgi:hypothetical protein